MIPPVTTAPTAPPSAASNAPVMIGASPAEGPPPQCPTGTDPLRSAILETPAPVCDTTLEGAHREWLDAVQWQASARSPAEQQQAATQVDKARASLDYELTDRNIAFAMSDHARALEANGAGASFIMQDILRRGVELFELSPQCRGPDGATDPGLVMDRAVAATGRVLDGSKGIRSLDLAMMIGAGDEHTVKMRELTASFPPQAFYPAHDRSKGATDLKDDYDDHTETQASHTFNFVLTGYSLPATTSGLLVSEGGNVWHETVEGFSGATVEDYNASKHAAIAGAALRHGRERGTDVPSVAPAVIAGVFSTESEHYSYEINGRAIDHADTAQAISDAMAADIETVDPARGAVHVSEAIWGGARRLNRFLLGD